MRVCTRLALLAFALAGMIGPAAAQYYPSPAPGYQPYPPPPPPGYGPPPSYSSAPLPPPEGGPPPGYGQPYPAQPYGGQQQTEPIPLRRRASPTVSPRIVLAAIFRRSRPRPASVPRPKLAVGLVVLT